MQVPKPTEADKARFRSLVPDAPGVEVKPMFGNLGGFVNGNMFMGLFGPEVGVKLAPAELEELRAHRRAPDRSARRSDRWRAGPRSRRDQLGTADGAAWIGRALSHVRTLPPKKPKG